jgi:hypothetical protein
MPSHWHWHFAVSGTAGRPLIRTAVAPGVQGLPVAGMQGAGVGTPEAAAVALCTAGFAGLVHIPKLGTFAMGLVSVTTAS